jgi:hypothetical protein
MDHAYSAASLDGPKVAILAPHGLVKKDVVDAINDPLFHGAFEERLCY